MKLTNTVYRALVNVKDSTGKSILSGKNVTGLSNIEEDMIKATKVS